MTKGASAVKFGLHVRLLVHEIDHPVQAFPTTEPELPLREQLDTIYDNLVGQEEGNPALLDSDMNVTMLTENRATAEVRLTVETADAGQALDVGLSCLRAAIHYAGIYTAHWGDPISEGKVNLYTLEATEEAVEARPLIDA